ncbi:NADP-dependent oxidoreductase [Bacillus sp. FJAT-45350]|uniref:NADP-dependent oxidoreductase n=1 Tax=Bacillus sp. FJAT-45350 TaxID=2011014 RepID=UPI000BB69C34|nr:NADP-dependent oxidoreductase [Bacillus sp. FJAT-45350]
MNLDNRQILLASRPKEMIQLQNFEITNTVITSIQKEQVLVKSLYLSIDPYMRGRMNNEKSYIAPFNIGEPLKGRVIGEVVKSNLQTFKVGDLVTGMLDWADYTLANEEELKKLEDDIQPITTHLHILGMPGLTAYFGLTKIGKPRKNETFVVSGAGGAVGMIVGQLAKLYGCKVVGITGSEYKKRYLKEVLHFDHVINYKIDNLKKELKKVSPDGVDIYFDNVGGEISDVVCLQMNFHGRVVLCGQISQYNNGTIEFGPRLFPYFLTRSIKLGAFILRDYNSEFVTAKRELLEWFNEGKLLHKEHLIEGLENAPNALIGLFQGDNIGKMLVSVN